MEELSVSALVPMDAQLYEGYADRRSTFAMMIRLGSGLRRIWIGRDRQRGTWELPSGKVEPEDEPARTADWELQEEAGARAKKLHPVGVLLTRLGQVLSQGHLYRGGIDRSGRPTVGLGDGGRSRLLL
jgi:8-oxo-dGTP pyrophosphatase MutT (NUDIX family)